MATPNSPENQSQNQSQNQLQTVLQRLARNGVKLLNSLIGNTGGIPVPNVTSRLLSSNIVDNIALELNESNEVVVSGDSGGQHYEQTVNAGPPYLLIFDPATHNFSGLHVEGMEPGQEIVGIVNDIS